jgi:hypothetical protein
MAIVEGMEKLYSMTARKRFGYTKEQKAYIKAHGHVDEDYITPPQGGIYQRRHTKRGTIYVRMKYYCSTNPRTPAQQANRYKIRDGWTAYGLLTNEQKAEYAERAKEKRITGPNLFFREYLLTH